MARHRLLLRQHQHADADHQRHDDRRVAAMSSALKFTLHTCASTSVTRLAAEHQAHVFTQHGIGAGEIFRGELVRAPRTPAASPRSSRKNSVDPRRPTTFQESSRSLVTQSAPSS